jgi:pantoate--beta-alanine ligase
MKIIKSLKEMSDFAKSIREKGKTLGFVPTMGALHKGHLSLIRQAGKENDFVVVSIFVNPTQFAPREDFKKYPRNLTQDTKICGKAGVDIIFFPTNNSMYPKNYKTYVGVDGLSDILCGKFRYGHFKGVTTVVNKLFNIVNPNTAYFGQKDAQQSIIIKRMAKDLNMPVKIKVMPTVREADGLAMSSRNVYLNKDERNDAIVLYQALMTAQRIINQKNLDSSSIIQKMRQLINRKKSAKIQYIAIVDPKNLNPIRKIRNKALIALGVWIGNIRLIDNVIINSENHG